MLMRIIHISQMDGPIKIFLFNYDRTDAAMLRQTAVTAYSKNQQLLLFYFALQDAERTIENRCS